MSAILSLLLLPLIPTDRVEIRALSAEQRRACVEHVMANGAAPIDYLRAKFVQHDVVVLGETHWVRQSCRLVAESLKPLHAAGVRVLATEFLRRRHNPQVKELVLAAEWDRELALALMRDLPWPNWGLQEYLDILHAAWRVNRARPAGSEPLIVLGLDSDWTQHQLWFEIEDRVKKFELQLARERTMVAVLEEQVLAKGHKALVHIGYSHSITCQGERLATVLSKRHGAKLFQVALHQNLPAAPKGNAMAAYLEALHAQAGGRAVGFDVVGSPLAPLYDAQCPTFRFLKDGTLGMLAQGYIVHAPLAEQRKCTWIPGFITAERFEEALAISIREKLAQPGECASPEELDRLYAEKFKK